MLAGLGLWVNPLVVVYLVPVGVYLLFSLRGELWGRWIASGLAGCVAGAFPLIDYNLHSGLATAQAMFGGSAGLGEAPVALYRFFRYSLPVIAGLAQPSSSQQFFWPSFWASPAASPLVTGALGAAFLLGGAINARSVWALLRGLKVADESRALLVLLLLAVPAVFVLSRFRELVTEPRYLLPLYSTIPLFAVSLVCQRGTARRTGGALVFAAVLGLNMYGIAGLNASLNLPDTAVGSTPQNREVLASFLLDRGLDRVYTDYWIAYPLAFETQERVLPSVISGGFNRYIPYAYYVSVSENPGFVFISGSKEELSFSRSWRRGRCWRGEKSWTSTPCTGRWFLGPGQALT